MHSTRHHSLFALALAWPSLWLAMALCPHAVVAEPAVCEVAAELASGPDFAATPRDDEAAETLALWYAEGLVAEGDLYERIHLDLALLRSRPEVNLWEPSRQATLDSVFLRFDDFAVMEAAKNGDNPSFECLTEALETIHTQFLRAQPIAFSYFDGRYEIDRVGELFERVPGIESTGPNSKSVPLTGCYHSPDRFRRVYFFEEIVTPFFLFSETGRVERIEFTAAGGIRVEEHAHRDDAPWKAEYEACLAKELSGDLDGGPTSVEEIPTLGETGWILLAISLAGLGLLRLRLA